jgi:hypothetical protein
VVLDVFRGGPTSLASFLDIASMSVLARRLQNVGASVFVASREPGWQAILRLSRTDARPVVTAEGPDGVPVASFPRPVAVIGAGRALVGGSTARAAGTPWSLSIATLPGVDLGTTTQAREADVVLIGGTDPASAGTLARALELRADAASWICGVDDDHIVVVVGRSWTVVALDPTVDELRLRAATAGWQRTRARRARVEPDADR